MDFGLVQARWLLGEFPAAELPGVAGEAMVSGFEGPALLQLVSFHNPEVHDLDPALVDRAFCEMGLDPLTVANAIVRVAREVARSICHRDIPPNVGAKRIWDLT